MAAVDSEDYRRLVYEAMTAVAPGWERHRARIEQAVTPVRAWMIRELAPRAGDTVLELAAGVGDTGFEAAAIVGDSGRLISTDFSRGGRLSLAVWGAPECNPWVAILAQILVEHGHLPPPEAGDPSPFSMASEERTRALLEGAGFMAVRTEQLPTCLIGRDVDDYLQYTTDTAGPLALVLRKLSAGERDAVKVRLAEAFARFAADGGYELPGVALGALAS